jgi:HPt (histidine-containing phosphotransfer) domain-containing protein
MLEERVLHELGKMLDTPEQLAEIVEIFRVSAQELVEELGAAVEKGDPAGMEFSSHTLKSCAGSMGAHRLAALAAEIEHGCRESTPERLAAAMPPLRKEVCDVSAALVALLARVHEAGVAA